MTDNITVTGVVGTDPSVRVTPQGLAIVSFRLASTRRYFDRTKGTWEDGETNWYSVSGFRQLAYNTAESVHRGQRVIVQGRLRLRKWENGEKSGTSIDLDADTIGHDLCWGTTEFTKVRIGRDSTTEAASGAGAEGDGGGAGGAAGWPGVEPSQGAPDASESGFESLDHTAADSDLRRELV